MFRYLLPLMLTLASGTVRGEAPAVHRDRYGDPLPPGALARMGSVRLKHRDRFFAALLSPDGKTLVSLGHDRLRVWELPSGRQRWRAHYPGLESWAPQFVISPNGKRLVTKIAAREGRFIFTKGLRIVDLATGEDVCACPGAEAPLAFSPDGRTLATKENGEGGVALRDAITGKTRKRLTEKEDDPYHAAFTSEGKSLITLDMKACLLVWDVASGKVVRRITPAVLGPLERQNTRWGLDSLSPDGSLAALVLNNGSVVIWDVARDRERFRLPGIRSAPLFSADGKTLCCQSGEAVAVVDANSGRITSRIADQQEQAAAALSADGRTLVTRGDRTSQCSPRLWDTRSGAELPRREAEHRGKAGAVAFSPSGKTLATVGEDASVRLWDAASGRQLLRVQRKPDFRLGRWVFFSADGQTVWAQHGLQSFLSFDAATGKQAEPRCVDVDHALGGVVASPDGHLLLIDKTDYRTKRTLYLVEARTGKEIRSFTTPVGGPGGRSQAAGEVVFSPDSKLLAVSDFLHTIRLYDVGSGKEVRRIIDGTSKPERAVHAVAFSPDGRILASAGGGWGGGRWQPEVRPDNGVNLWDVPTGRQVLKLRTIHDEPWEDRIVSTVAFAPDGRTLATGGMDAAVRIWETATGLPLGKFEDEGNQVHQVAFSPDGEQLAAAMHDGSALIWDWKPIGWRPAGETPSPEQLNRCWRILGGDDGRAAHHAIYTLAASPRQTVPFLRARLKPAPDVPPERIRQLIADLDSDDFARREAATNALAKLGPAVESDLHQALTRNVSLEMKKRLQGLLEAEAGKWAVADAEERRAVRAIWALERIGDAEARKVLTSLAAGAKGARLTREARNALDWLDRRAKLPHD